MVPTPLEAMLRALSALLAPLAIFLPVLLFRALEIVLVTLFPALEFITFFPSVVEASCLPRALVLEAAAFRLEERPDAAVILLPRPFAFLKLEIELLTPSTEEAADTALSAVLKVDLAAFPTFEFAALETLELTVLPTLDFATLEPAFVLASDFPRAPTLDAVDFKLLITEDAALIFPEAPFAFLNDERDDFRFLALLYAVFAFWMDLTVAELPSLVVFAATLLYADFPFAWALLTVFLTEEAADFMVFVALDAVLAAVLAPDLRVDLALLESVVFFAVVVLLVVVFLAVVLVVLGVDFTVLVVVFFVVDRVGVVFFTVVFLVVVGFLTEAFATVLVVVFFGVAFF